MKYRVRRLVVGNLMLAVLGTVLAAVIAFAHVSPFNGATLLALILVTAAVVGIVRAMKLATLIDPTRPRHTPTSNRRHNHS